MMLSPLITLFLACNPSRYLRNDWAEPLYDGTTTDQDPISHELPQLDGDSSPAALNGKPYRFFYYPSLSGSNATWTIYLQGGGWCYDEVDCYCRTKTYHGSPNLAHKGPKVCENVDKDGNQVDCNYIYLPYLDGASFSGFRAGPVPVPPGGPDNIPENQTIYFRGHVNLVHSIKYALANLGLDQAQYVVQTGTSAGGLSTYLHTDYIGEEIKKGTNGNLKRYHALPIVGYFLDHDNLKHTKGTTGPNTPEWANPEGNNSAPYPTWMKYVYTMQNLTFGETGGLTQACQALYPNDPYKCFFSPHMGSLVKTPLFVFNSQYDAWQLTNILQIGTNLMMPKSDFISPELHPAVIQYGKDFIDQLQPLLLSPKNGAFITSCICHNCDWHRLSVNNKTSYQHYAEWLYGNVTGNASVHFDTRDPSSLEDVYGCFRFRS